MEESLNNTTIADIRARLAELENITTWMREQLTPLADNIGTFQSSSPVTPVVSATGIDAEAIVAISDNLTGVLGSSTIETGVLAHSDNSNAFITISENGLAGVIVNTEPGNPHPALQAVAANGTGIYATSRGF